MAQIKELGTDNTQKLNLSFKKLTCDICHMTHDMWHVTCDTWYVTRLGGVNILSKFQLPSSSCLWYYEDLEEKGHWINHLMIYKAVYRTGPATPGLLIIETDYATSYLPNDVNSIVLFNFVICFNGLLAVRTG